MFYFLISESEFSTTSNEVQESYETGNDDEIQQKAIPPLHQQVENLQRSEGKRITSSYENVYDGVGLDPKINRMSGDASQLDIGDRFDTKQAEHLQASERSSSYEQIYDKEAVLGESIEKTSSRHACPVYITVEEGLDKLSSDEPKSDIHKDFKERSLSCETQLEVDQKDLRYRHNSSPDMSVFTLASYQNEFSRGSSLPYNTNSSS